MTRAITFRTIIHCTFGHHADKNDTHAGLIDNAPIEKYCVNMENKELSLSVSWACYQRLSQGHALIYLCDNKSLNITWKLSTVAISIEIAWTNFFNDCNVRFAPNERFIAQM